MVNVISCLPHSVSEGHDIEEFNIPAKRIRKYVIYRSLNHLPFSVGIYFGDDYELFHDDEYDVETIIEQLKNAEY